MLKAEILSPPDSSILLSMLYEGLLLLKAKCGNHIDVKNLHELCNLDGKTIKFNFTGNDMKALNALSKKYNIKLPKNFDEFRNLMRKFNLTDLVIKIKIEKGKAFLVGTQSFLENIDREEKYSFQIMKVDRYQGITSLESGLIDKQVTCYTDLSGIYLFFLGLSSSYVTASESEGKDNYYFLFFDIGTLNHSLENPTFWMPIKNILSNGLKEVLDKTKKIVNELVILSVLLNISAIENLKKGNIKMAGFRLIRISKEGNTYKVYEDIPLSIFVAQKIYEEKELASSLQKALEVLIDPVSRFLNGRDSKGDGYHAYMALRFLFYYVTTGNPEYLEYFYRELHIANEIDPNKGYLKWVSKRVI